MPATLRARLIAATALLLAAVSGLLVAVLPSRLDALSRRWMESRALGIAGVVARATEPALDFDDAAAAAAAIAPLGETARYAVVVRGDGGVLAAAGVQPPALLGAAAAPVTAYEPDVLRVRFPAATRSGTQGAIELGFGLGELEERRREARALVVALSALLLAGGLAAAWAIGTTLARPVRRVTEVAARIAAGEEGAARDLPLADRGEAGALARAFHRMVERLLQAARTIREMNERLAARVDERTRELERTNQALAELRRTQEQLVVADRRVSIGRLAAGVGHEINNPLTFVAGNLEWLEDELDRERRRLVTDPGGAAARLPEVLEEMQRAVRESLGGADRVRRIVRQLRTFSRGDEEERREPMHVTEAIEVAIDMGRHETKHRARIVRAYGAAPTVRASPVQLAQVFLNLLVNAAQAIRPGAADENEIRIAVSTDAEGWATVTVRDTGAGIPAEVMPRLFEPFFTTKPMGEGSGLGLSVSRGIVRALGGDIVVESTPGTGSAFTVRLPPGGGAAADTPIPPPQLPDPAGAAAEPGARERPGGERRVLLVDDEPLVLSSLARLLRPWGEVQTAESGRDALARLRSGSRFDVILCDVMMPEMTGIELYRNVCAELPQQAARFVFVTGGASDAAASEFLAGWTGPYLFKPVNVDKLRRVVDERRW